MSRELEEKLKAFFPENELEWRIQSCGIKNESPWSMVLCYIQARAIQNRLDEVMGFQNWKDEYRVEGKDIICRLSLKIGDEWVAKENGATETDIEAFKGGISGAFKRVASSGFGIGRYLYELDNTFAVCELELSSEMKKTKRWHQAKTKENKYIFWETPNMLSKFLPKENKNSFLNSNGTVDKKELVDKVVNPCNAEDLKNNCDAYEKSIRMAINLASTTEDITKCGREGTMKREWKTLQDFRLDSFNELYKMGKDKYKQLEDKPQF